MDNEPTTIGTWRRISILGSGAFGIVALWYDSATNDYIAVKKCKFTTPGSMTDRQRKRWQNEVNVMENLNVPTIIGFKPLPSLLGATLQKYNPTKLPLLSMEYATKGNLRHVLTQVKNASGLPEADVRIVLEDITKAVAYLHQRNITHRDIKPENIVLQECADRPGGVIYKLIDLGYAKELNDATVSFVGTLHYLAPEILKTEHYNYSVDYWSMGILASEIICGVLPFLPQYNPTQRFQYIEQKKHNDICIYLLHSGSVAYSSEMVKENHITVCLKHQVEIWLRHVLEFNPELRSQNFPDNVKVFDKLLEILRKRIIQVFSVNTLEFYSYEINESTLIGTLKDWIARDTRVLKDDQVLLTNSKFFIANNDEYVVNILSKDESSMFVLKKGDFVGRDSFKMPKYVQILFEKCTDTFKWRELRPIYIKALFFLTQEHKLVTNLLNTVNLAMNYIKYLTVRLKVQMQNIRGSLSMLLVKLQCYYNIRKANYRQINMEYSEKYKQALLHFNRLMTCLERCMKNFTKLTGQISIFNKRHLVLNKFFSTISEVIAKCDTKTPIDKATELLTRGASGSNKSVSCLDMVKIISQVIKTKDKLLQSDRFKTYTRALSVSIKETDCLLNWMNDYQQYIKELAVAIDDAQTEQHLLIFECLKTKRKYSSLVNGYDNDDVLDTDALIRDNQNLRYLMGDTLGKLFMDIKRFSEGDISIATSSKP